jgi:hypothetical protein
MIELDKITTRYIDLKEYQGKTAPITGRYKGDRLVFSNATGVTLDFDAQVESTHAEDAICFLGAVTDVTIKGKLILNNALTFWDVLNNVDISGIVSKDAHTGIRATQPKPSNNVRIHDCLISFCQYEGIYIGPSYATDSKLTNIKIEGNKIVNSGWDAIQVGNCAGAYLEGNTVINAATKNEYGQNYAITINPGSRAYLRGNTLINCKQKMQVLDSRAFWF